MGRFLLCLALAVLAGCQLFRAGKSGMPAESMPDLAPVFVDYADTDAFDGQFEAALVASSPAIVVRTESAKPDWKGRLNAWIAAWNGGGRSKARTVRGQLGLPKLDGESIRELRLLADDLLDRAEGVARPAAPGTPTTASASGGSGCSSPTACASTATTGGWCAWCSSTATTRRSTRSSSRG